MTKTFFTVSTPVGRLRHAFFQAPRLDALSKKMMYSGTLLVPKTRDVSALTEAIAKSDAEYKEANKKFPSKYNRSVMLDGDDLYAQQAEEGSSDESYKGHWVVKLKATEAPECYNFDKSPIERPLINETLYPGCWAQAIIKVFYYTEGNHGVTSIVAALRKIKDDAPLRPKTNILDLFADVSDSVDDLLG